MSGNLSRSAWISTGGLWQKIDLLQATPWYRRMTFSWKPGLALAAAVVLVATAFVMDHGGTVAQTHDVSITEVDQVEKTLDDVQLLKQFDSTVTETAASKTAM